MSRVTIYSMTGCPWCRFARAKLRQNKIAFTEIKDRLPPGYNSYPQMFVGQKNVGGYSDMDKWVGKYKTKKPKATPKKATPKKAKKAKKAPARGKK